MLTINYLPIIILICMFFSEKKIYFPFWLWLGMTVLIFL